MILDGCPLFPQAVVPLFIFEPRYRSLLADALAGERMMCLAMSQPGVSQERPCKLAGLGLIRVSVANADGTSNLVLQGVSRVRLGRAVQTKPYRVHLIEPVEEEAKESLILDALAARTMDLVEARLRLATPLPLSTLSLLAGSTDSLGSVRIQDCLQTLRHLKDPGALADLVATLLLPDVVMRQVVLQSVEVEERLRQVVHFLTTEIARLQKDPAL